MKKKPISKPTYISFNGHGIDVALNRADDLDRLSLEHFSQKNAPRVLDLGCGAGGHSMRMSKTGTNVLAVDVHDFSEVFLQLQEQVGVQGQPKFIYGDIRNLPELIDGRTFTDTYMQRTLHYLRYTEALSLLEYLFNITDDKLFISTMGIASEDGKGYSGNNLNIKDRFTALSVDNREKFSIKEPVCLYKKDEFVELLNNSGWRVEKCWQSAFGNIKAVCAH